MVNLVSQMDMSINVGNILTAVIALAAVVKGLMVLRDELKAHGAKLGEVNGDVQDVVHTVRRVEATTNDLKVAQTETNANLRALDARVGDHALRIRDIEKAKG